MSEKTASSAEDTPTPEKEGAPRTRRISNPRPKKVAKEAVEPTPIATPELASIPFPKTPRREEDSEDISQPGNDWPEPEGESTGGSQSPSESSKRKRRRRKGKGQSSQAPNSNGPQLGEAHLGESSAADTSKEQAPRPNPPPRPKIDPELLAKFAWKIYLAEVSEEGVALISDSDAKDLSRRCFRLAEIFIEEQSRRR